jgi:probable rRNA maturation factor
MARHSILMSGEVPYPRWASRLAARCIRTALRLEGVRVPCEISVMFTDDEGIRTLNRELRGVDKPTDVLSFPAFEFTPEAFDPAVGETDPESGLLPIGDMALNLDRIRLQGREYGTGEKHETAYLTVHSVLHLLGYDHVDEGEGKKQMRARERAIMRMMRL